MHVLEPATSDQCETIAALIEHVIATSVDAAPAQKAAFVANTRANLAQWLATPDRCVHVCARSGSELVGVVLVRDWWNLCHLFVDPRHQGRGVGRRLLEAALAACAGRAPHGRVRLNASRNAIGFYRRMGFSEVPDAPAHLQGMQFERPLRPGCRCMNSS